ncbi:MAG TPA: site-specific integrase [Polyangia bacterium]|nr:site-specific integrase [Polyangia bacterium]
MAAAAFETFSEVPDDEDGRPPGAREATDLELRYILGHDGLLPPGLDPVHTQFWVRGAEWHPPALERLDDIRRVFLALPQRYGVAFALGALAGLRPGEVLGLDWRDVDLATGRILVRQQVHRGELRPVKDDDSRIVPILPPPAPVLSEWRLLTRGTGLLFAPGTRGGRPGSPPRFVRDHTLRAQLRKALRSCGPPETMTVYSATRHTFAAQWVLGGGSIEKLREVLGHASVTTTERCAHLRTDLFRESDLRAGAVDLSRPGGQVLQLRADSRPIGAARVQGVRVQIRNVR